MDSSIDVTVSKEKWMSVPAFGDWEKLKGGGMPDYSMDFSKIREKRKESKSKCSQISIMGNEEALLSQSSITTSTAPSSFIPHKRRQTSPVGRKTFRSYFGCCGANNIPS